jgi:molybdate transport system ATP-binding protein
MRLRLDVELALLDFKLAVDVDRTANAFGIYGASGAGKTTLLELIAGIRKPDRGEIVIDERVISALPSRARRIGYVPQDDTLFPHMSVRANITYGLSCGADFSPRPNAVADLTNSLAIDHLLDRGVAKLSGGERRRVAIARALLTDPAVLLLDEPLSGVDPALSSRMLEMLRDLRSRVPIVLVSHARQELEAVCDEVMELDRGRIVP